MHNDVVAWHPIDGRSDSVLVASLERIDHAKDFGRVPSGGGRIGHDQSDGLLGIDHEDRADGESDTLLINIGGVLLVEHIIQECHLSLFVADDGELEVAATDLVDVLDPAVVLLDRVGRETDELHATPGEFRLQFGESTQLRGADGSVVLWVGEEDNPVIANEFMEVDRARSGLSVEVWSNIPQTQAESC